MVTTAVNAGGPGGLKGSSPVTSTGRGSGAWGKIAFAMFAVGWGANQFSPMLIVYRHELRLGAGAIAGLFLVYALTLIPGLLVGGAAVVALARTPEGAPARPEAAIRRRWPPAAVRTRRFWLGVVPASPMVFGSVSLTIVVLPEEVTSARPQPPADRRAYRGRDRQRQRATGRRHRLPLGRQEAHELSHEEGVSLRLLVDGRHQRGGRVPARDGFDEPGHLGLAQAAQAEIHGDWLAG